MLRHSLVIALALMTSISTNAEPSASKESSANKEPSANKESSTVRQPLAITELLADQKPAANKTAAAKAPPKNFSKGPVFLNYGTNAIIEDGLDNPEAKKFKVVFDIAERNDNDDINRKFDTVARFINMHVQAGVPLDNIDVAIVVHGKASLDLLSNEAYQQRFDKLNANDDLLNRLLDTNVNLFICGQSASFLGITKNELNPRVKISLSAMTANALLQQQGYTLNPF